MIKNNAEIEKIKLNALKRHIPIIIDDTLNVIINMLKTKEVRSGLEKNGKLLEIGTAIGYSAICLSPYFNKIDTIEIDIEKCKEANENIEKLNLTSKVNIICGDAINELPKLKDSKDSYDAIFIDAAKSKYPQFLEYSLHLLKEDGIIFADNILYKGYVLGEYNKHKQRTAVNNLRKFIKMAKENNDIRINIIEVGDGLAVITKTESKREK